MIEIIKEHPKAVIFAVVFHLVILIVVGVSLDWTSITKPSSQDAPIKIVNAVAVDEKLLNTEIKKIKDAEKKRVNKQKAAERKAKKALVNRKREEKKLKELKAKNKKETAKQIVLKKKREADLKAEKARKVKVKKQKQKKAEAKRKKALKVAAEKKRKKQFEDELKKKLAKEETLRQQQVKAANEAKRQSEIGKYIDTIIRDVKGNWIVSKNVTGKVVLLFVKVLPGGEVLDVKIKKSSGDAIYDRDATKAVYNASPLPVPPAGSDLFEEFRGFNLRLGKQE